jgi:hypothetical protein
MSNIEIRKALETQLIALDNSIATAWENVDFSPANNEPFQIVHFLYTQPGDVGFKNGPYLQQGYMQVSLQYPTNQGSGAAQAKAEMLRAGFFRGLSLSANGITTVIAQTPEILAAIVENDRYSVKVRIRFYAYIGV